MRRQPPWYGVGEKGGNNYPEGDFLQSGNFFVQNIFMEFFFRSSFFGPGFFYISCSGLSLPSGLLTGRSHTVHISTPSETGEMSRMDLYPEQVQGTPPVDSGRQICRFFRHERSRCFTPP